MIVPILHLVSTLYMGGLIVFVQVVHYPLMGRVGSHEFPGYEEGHATRTTWVVVPLMVTELGSALWLAVFPAGPGDRPLALLGLALLAVIWLSTALLQAPAHGRLSRGFDEGVHRRLVRTNWIRTVTWVARVPVALMLAL
jgi:hypothetical protein